MPIHIDGDEATSIRVESCYRTCYILDVAFECRGRARFEAKEEPPQWAHCEGFEGSRGEDCGASPEWFAKRRRGNAAGAEADHE